ncbi:MULTISPECIES: hypothetical protein [unclassified Tolypothrix]|nr:MULTISPECIES: hypothetical protein [unclassified Tolypothrix]EKF00433.1 hypothetical protein FDUTEX481_09096 [Tolypothrix sp. PCC 7601]MBE9085798.1 hypothetical protein [Tolypothrix sp. LEGE 11397]UYD27043.1 hypothetical protein HGR01_02740 [Tolypothrix sp. PCC 7712]UYD37099.1 hypothetical protein HG267_16035 [Tolypothrix sp. PCC 7601]
MTDDKIKKLKAANLFFSDRLNSQALKLYDIYTRRMGKLMLVRVYSSLF